jgi:hypothetical protein
MIQSQAMIDNMLISPAAITNGATSSANLDTVGAAYASIRVCVSNIAQATIASADGISIKLQESDDTNASNFATFTGFATKTGIKLAQEVRYEIDCKARKRYLRVSLIGGTSGVTNEPFTACVVGTLSRLQQAPAGTAVMVAGTTNDQVVLG